MLNCFPAVHPAVNAHSAVIGNAVPLVAKLPPLHNCQEVATVGCTIAPILHFTISALETEDAGIIVLPVEGYFGSFS